jgi:hypothetical protein
MQKKKIAICFSGQTRHFNKDPRYTQDFYEVLDLFDEFDYDLFGHNWSDHADPHSEVLDKFTEYRSDDQEIIWDAITDLRAIPNQYFPVWEQFFQTKEEWYKKPEYIDMLKGNSDVNYIEFAKERIKGNIGQVWSAHESFLLTSSHWQKTFYSVVVRVRWDLMIKYFHGHEWVNANKQRFKDILYNWVNKQDEFKDNHRWPDCLCSDDCVFEYNSTPYANDHMYLFDGGAFTKNGLYIKQPVDMFSSLLYHYINGPHNFPRLPSAHSLWMDWIQYAGFRVSPKLPHLFQANGPSEGKTNKEWNI